MSGEQKTLPVQYTEELMPYSPPIIYKGFTGEQAQWVRPSLKLTALSTREVGVRVLAEMAGHASIQTTQRYIDVNDGQMGRVAELIGGKSC